MLWGIGSNWLRLTWKWLCQLFVSDNTMKHGPLKHYAWQVRKIHFILLFIVFFVAMNMNLGTYPKVNLLMTHVLWAEIKNQKRVKSVGSRSLLEFWKSRFLWAQKHHCHLQRMPVNGILPQKNLHRTLLINSPFLKPPWVSHNCQPFKHASIISYTLSLTY